MKRYIKSSEKITDYVDSKILDAVLIGVFGDNYDGFIDTDSMTIKVFRSIGDQTYKVVKNDSSNWDCYLIEDPNQYFIFNDIGEILEEHLD